MCGIFGISANKEAAHFSYLGLYALQHRGEEGAGIFISGPKKARYHKGMGLVSDVFSEKIIKSLPGQTAIGHVRYSTTGSSSTKNVQPFFVNHRHGHIAIAHNGNLINALTLRNQMEDEGSVFQTSIDSEIIVHLLAKSIEKNIQARVLSCLSQLQGAYSLTLVLDGMLIGARDPLGFRPLCIGKLDGAYVLASETCALDLIRAQYVRDVAPGEVVFINKGNLESIKLPQAKRRALCIFEYIYFSRPDSNIFGHNVYMVRKELGRQLAREYKIDCDLVMPIPDSGSYAALGYAEQSGLPFEAGMIRNHYIGRTFIQPSQTIRDFKVRIKLNPIKDILKGKKVMVVEDSIVRGTTCRARVKAIREAGAKEIHMVVSCPPIVSPCYYGIDFPTKKELIASKYSVEKIKDFIGLDSLNYLSLEGMLKSMPLACEEFCTACFNRNYPTKIPKQASKNRLEKNF